MKKWMQSPAFVRLVALALFLIVGHVLYQWAMTGTLPLKRGRWGTYDQDPVHFTLSAFAVFGMLVICVAAIIQEGGNLFGLRGVFPLKPMWHSFRSKARKPKD